MKQNLRKYKFHFISSALSMLVSYSATAANDLTATTVLPATIAKAATTAKAAATAKPVTYQTSKGRCAGFPQIRSLKTSPDRCVGLVADKSMVPWSFPRKILAVNNTLYVSAFGGWKENSGQIWKLNLSDDLERQVHAEQIFQNTQQTHGLRRGPDGWIYFGDRNAIYRFAPENPTRSEVVISDLLYSFELTNGKVIGNHPLKEFLFLPNGDLIVNIGSPSNDCEEEFKLSRTCTQRDSMGLLRRYPYQASRNNFGPFQVIARGLRNSMGLYFNPIRQELYQAENAADAVGTPDEMNRIEFSQLAKGKVYDFGWPYCSGTGGPYKGYENYRSFCKKADRPFLLMPAHAAPLEMTQYKGDMFPELSGSLLVSWHGHRPSGSRIAIYKTNSQGQVLTETPAQLVEAWNADPQGRHPKGRPVGVAVDSKGAIFVLDDVNEVLLVIAKADSSSLPSNAVEDHSSDISEKELGKYYSEKKLREWESLFPKLITAKSCAQCHGDIVQETSARSTLAKMIGAGWLKPGAEAQPLWIRMTGQNGVRLMPPSPLPNLFMDREKGNGLFERFAAWLQPES